MEVVTVKSLRRIFIFIIFVTVIAAGALAYSLSANEIGYTPLDPTWKNDDGTDITNTKEALDVLYSNAKKIEAIYPTQKFVLSKAINGYVYTFSVYDEYDNLIYTTTYDCGLWGEFASTTKTYVYGSKVYTIIASGVNAKQNFKAYIKCDNYDLFTFLAYASGDNGSWDTNTTETMKEIIRYQDGLYYKK